MKQFGLFPEEINTQKKNNKLVISKSKKNKVLSKEQTIFNQYRTKIETLRKQLKNDEIKYNNLSGYFQSNVIPSQENYANSLIDFVKQLFALYNNEKLSKNHKEKTSQLILFNLSEAFRYVIPTDDVKAIYDQFSDTTFEEEETEQLKFMQESLKDMFNDMFGEDFNFPEIDLKMYPEELARKMAELKEHFEKQSNEEGQKEKKKKTKQALNIKIKQKQEEEIQKKNLRAIYTSLAKILHPDLETDENLKLEKEELMKQVTNAYQAKDLYELLKLEIEIIHQQSENIDHLSDQKLKIINSALKEQVEEVMYEIEMLRTHPKYDKIEDFIIFSEKTALKKMAFHIEELQEMKSGILADVEELSGKNKVNFLTSMLKQPGKDDSFDEIPDFLNIDEEELMNVFEKLQSMMGNKKKK